MLVTEVDVDVRVRWSEPGLRRALVVLIDNAIVHSPDSAVVRVEAGVEQSRAVVRVLDQGFGLRGVDPERVFDRFAHGADEGRRRGFGIGLSLVRGLAVRSGGGVAMAWTSPEGTVMRLELLIESG